MRATKSSTMSTNVVHKRWHPITMRSVHAHRPARLNRAMYERHKVALIPTVTTTRGTTLLSLNTGHAHVLMCPYSVTISFQLDRTHTGTNLSPIVTPGPTHVKCGKYYVERNGSPLIAFAVDDAFGPGNGAAVIAANLDMLTAMLKPVLKSAVRAGMNSWAWGRMRQR